MPGPGGDFLTTTRETLIRREQQQTELARAYLKRISADPDKARQIRERKRLALACLQSGKLSLAAEVLEPLMDTKTGDATAAELMADVQLAANNLPKAEAALVRSIHLDPRQPRTLVKFGALLARIGRLTQARALLHEAIAQKEDYAEAYVNLGLLHGARGEHQLALDGFELAMHYAPKNPTIGSMWVTRHAYPEQSDDRDLLKAGREWERRYLTGVQPLPPAAVEPLAGRRLRVGYVSPDFRRHSTAYFFLPLIEHHDRSRFEVFCYHDSRANDDLTAAIRDRAEHWRWVHGRSDEQLAQTIRRDRIDVLVDLAGHFANPHLTMHALRPAPVHVHHIGFCGTTGLSCFTARTTDATIEPPHSGVDASSAEPLMRLDGPLHTFSPFDRLPEVQPTPALKNGFVTFGSFNANAKLNDMVFATWTEILRALPTAHLFIKNPELTDRDLQNHTRERFVAKGIDGARIHLAGQSRTRAEHLAEFHHVDVHLDSFPYNGVTTTCDALWMGVPVLTLRGNCHRGRVAESILKNAGEKDAWAADRADYVTKATTWAREVNRLQTERAARRDRVTRSRLSDGVAHARSIEAAWTNVLETRHSATEYR